MVKQLTQTYFPWTSEGLHKLHDGKIKPLGSGNQTCPSQEGPEASCPPSPTSLHRISPTPSSPPQYFTAH